MICKARGCGKETTRAGGLCSLACEKRHALAALPLTRESPEVVEARARAKLMRKQDAATPHWIGGPRDSSSGTGRR